jgi:hypothetical protein
VIIDNTEQLMQGAERQRLTTECKQIEEELQRRDAYLTEGQKISHTGSWACHIQMPPPRNFQALIYSLCQSACLPSFGTSSATR